MGYCLIPLSQGECAVVDLIDAARVAEYKWTLKNKGVKKYMTNMQSNSLANSLDRIFPVGTRSVLFGVHQIFWHGFTVFLAWLKLYKKMPTFWECVAIWLHDAPGYWGCPNMDGPEGEDHPKRSALFVLKLFCAVHRDTDRNAIRGLRLYRLVLNHSRATAKANGVEMSKLGYADKLSMAFDPERFYLLRARASGEIIEYRKRAEKYVASYLPDRAWFRWLRARQVRASSFVGTSADRY